METSKYKLTLFMLNSGKLKLIMKEGRQRGRNTGKTRLRT